MNRARKSVLACYGLAVAVVCTWVPWKAKLPGGGEHELGYSFFWARPEPYPYPDIVSEARSRGHKYEIEPPEPRPMGKSQHQIADDTLDDQAILNRLRDHKQFRAIFPDWTDLSDRAIDHYIARYERDRPRIERDRDFWRRSSYPYASIDNQRIVLALVAVTALFGVVFLLVSLRERRAIVS